MKANVTTFLWLLKLGALVNIYFLIEVFRLSGSVDAHIVVPGVILFAVSAFRCLFPNRYKDNVVFHDTPLSSIFVTRLLATAVEVAWIYQFSRVIRLVNVDDVAWVEVLSWLMVVQVVVSQGFVWTAILTGRLMHYFHEELGWAAIFAMNTAASLSLYTSIDDLGPAESLLELNLLFGLVYLPWQFFHVRSLRIDARADGVADAGLADAISVRNRRTDPDAWGGAVGLTWMVGYWATLIPLWVHHVIGELGVRSS